MTVAVESAAGNQAVNVGVVLQGPGPGVQNSQDADLSADIARVPGQLLEGLGCRTHKDGIEEVLVLANHASQGLWQGKDDVEVGYGEQLLRTLCQPDFEVLSMTLGAVAIAARVIGVALVATAVTLVEVTAELSGATGDQSPDHALMPLGHGGSMRIQIGRPVSAQDVGDLQHRAGECVTDDRSVG
jgi:hypothetical protein